MPLDRTGASYGLPQLKEAILELEDRFADVFKERDEMQQKIEALEYRIKLQENFKGKVANRPKPKRVPKFPDALRRIGQLSPAQRARKEARKKK